MTHAPSEAAMGAAAGGNGQDTTFWRAHTQISLQPVAAPSILGLFGFAAATFMVAANLGGWMGGPLAPVVLFPFAIVVGGIAQFLAGMWSYRARDGLATAIHGVWGSFWIAYGIFWLLVATTPLFRLAVISPAGISGLSTAGRQGLGAWFVVLAAITWVGIAAVVARNIAVTLVLATLASGSTILAIAWLVPYSTGVVQAAGDVLVASAVIAFYTATALMLEGVYQRTILPVGKMRPRTRPRHLQLEPIQYELGEPGVKAGQ